VSKEFPGVVAGMPCPQCGGQMTFHPTSRYGPFYACSNYPRCDCTHGAHPDGSPLGVPADKKTKVARIAAHGLFDRIWQGPEAPMTRRTAYLWLQQAMGMTDEEAHFGRFTAEQCERASREIRAAYPEVVDR